MPKPYDCLSEREIFLLALGTFVDRFAVAENNLKEMLGVTAVLSEEMRLALLSGVKTDLAISNIRRVYRAHGHEPPAHIESILAQLKQINDARNLMLHQGHTRAPKLGEYIAISTNLGATLGEPKTVRVSAETLSDMTSDLDHIITVTRVEIEGARAEPNRRKDARALPVPWRYKPQEQVKPRKVAQAKPSKKPSR
jgi:hypothetical protein